MRLMDSSPTDQHVAGADAEESEARMHAEGEAHDLRRRLEVAQEQLAEYAAQRVCQCQCCHKALYL